MHRTVCRDQSCHESSEHPNNKTEGIEKDHPIKSGTNGNARTLSLLLHGDAARRRSEQGKPPNQISFQIARQRNGVLGNLVSSIGSCLTDVKEEPVRRTQTHIHSLRLRDRPAKQLVTMIVLMAADNLTYEIVTGTSLAFLTPCA
jgi:hypothetical protein